MTNCRRRWSRNLLVSSRRRASRTMSCGAAGKDGRQNARNKASTSCSAAPASVPGVDFMMGSVVGSGQDGDGRNIYYLLGLLSKGRNLEHKVYRLNCWRSWVRESMVGQAWEDTPRKESSEIDSSCSATAPHAQAITIHPPRALVRPQASPVIQPRELRAGYSIQQSTSDQNRRHLTIIEIYESTTLAHSRSNKQDEVTDQTGVCHHLMEVMPLRFQNPSR